MKLRATPFRQQHKEKLFITVLISLFGLLIFGLLTTGFLKDNTGGLFKEITDLAFLIAGICGIIAALVGHLPYTKKIDYIIKDRGVVLPNPPRKDIISSKVDNPYFIPYESIRRIEKGKEKTLRMKFRGEKEPRKVCIIEKKNGNKIKIRPNYLAGDFDEFVDKLIEVYDQRKGEDH